jgi:hypothetical protein
MNRLFFKNLKKVKAKVVLLLQKVRAKNSLNCKKVKANIFSFSYSASFEYPIFESEMMNAQY